MDAIAPGTLAGALGLGARDLVALVGAGGKTSTLRLLAEELAATGRRVVATTTTAMFLSELADVGPVSLLADDGDTIAGLERALAAGGPAAVARAVDDGGKVVGLTLPEADALWASCVSDCLVVEADGSRGLPLKAFGPHEPQVPATTTTIVVVAGLDALGVALTEEYVHRADVLASILGIPLGSKVTPDVMADGLRAQVEHVRRESACRRIVVLLNKADTPDVQATGLDIARRLLGNRGAAVGPGVEGDRGTGEPTGRPDRVVVGSVHERRFTVAAEEE